MTNQPKVYGVPRCSPMDIDSMMPLNLTTTTDPTKSASILFLNGSEVPKKLANSIRIIFAFDSHEALVAKGYEILPEDDLSEKYLDKLLVLNVVTGGGGFIGLNLVKELAISENENILVIDKKSTGFNEKGFKYLKKKHKFDFIHDEVQKVDFEPLIKNYAKIKIFHLASDSHVDRSISEPDSVIKNNIDAGISVLEFARKNKKLVDLLIVSTDEVYGDEGPFPTVFESRMSPSSPYSASKAAVDLLAESYHRTYSIDVKISRCCNNFGRYQHSEKFLPTVLKAIRTGEPVPLYGKGNQERQWVPVEIHVKRLIEQMDHGYYSQNVGGWSMSNLDLVNAVGKFVDKDVKIKHIKDRPGHDVKYELHDPRSITHKDMTKQLASYVKQEMRGDA